MSASLIGGLVPWADTWPALARAAATAPANRNVRLRTLILLLPPWIDPNVIYGDEKHRPSRVPDNWRRYSGRERVRRTNPKRQKCRARVPTHGEPASAPFSHSARRSRSPPLRL